MGLHLHVAQYIDSIDSIDPWDDARIIDPWHFEAGAWGTYRGAPRESSG